MRKAYTGGELSLSWDAFVLPIPALSGEVEIVDFDIHSGEIVEVIRDISRLRDILVGAFGSTFMMSKTISLL